MRLDLASAATNKTVTLKDKVEAVIDQRFASVLAYAKIRRFEHLSSRTQWTGREQKSILRQVMPVFTPILQDIGAIDAIRFLRAVVDFILLAMYESHDDDTLRYLQLALFRMNQCKEVFRKFRPSKAASADCEEVGHFNFPKWHSIVHYVDLIKRFGNAPDHDSGHFERGHITWVKRGYKASNGKVGWEDQVMQYGQRKLNSIARNDPGLHARHLTVAKLRETSERFNKPTKAVDLPEYFGWLRKQFGGLDVKYDTWRTVADIEHLIGGAKGHHFR